jgi:NADH dehydrogenase
VHFGRRRSASPSSFPEDLARKAQQSLERLGVEIQTGTMVKEVDRDGLTVDRAGRHDRIAAHTVLWGGGVTMPPAARTIGRGRPRRAE